MKASDKARIHAALDLLLDALHTTPETPPQSTPISGWSQAPLVDKRELARLLSVSSATIDRQVRSGMPYQPVGDVKRFDIAECRAWLADRDKPSSPEPAAPPPASGPRALDQGGVRLLSRPSAPRRRS